MINLPFARLHLPLYRDALPAIGLRAAFDNPGEILVIKRTDKLRPEGRQVTPPPAEFPDSIERCLSVFGARRGFCKATPAMGTITVVGLADIAPYLTFKPKFYSQLFKL